MNEPTLLEQFIHKWAHEVELAEQQKVCPRCFEFVWREQPGQDPEWYNEFQVETDHAFRAWIYTGYCPECQELAWMDLASDSLDGIFNSENPYSLGLPDCEHDWLRLYYNGHQIEQCFTCGCIRPLLDKEE